MKLYQILRKISSIIFWKAENFLYKKRYNDIKSVTKVAYAQKGEKKISKFEIDNREAKEQMDYLKTGMGKLEEVKAARDIGKDGAVSAIIESGN
jgi:hypothetical protein